MLRSMKTALMLTGLTAALGLAAAAPLARDLPAGALLTLETQNAAPALNRLLGVVTQAAGAADMGEVGGVIGGLGEVATGTIGQQGVAGVFTVGTPKGGYTPALLAAAQVDRTSTAFFQSLIGKRPGAKVGNYSFTRQGSLFVGLSGGLVYVASDKTLLMAYLGRLSGHVAPRLNASAAYARPRQALGAQELSLYLNFSATAKVARAQLGQVLLPRLLSPLVDGLDTLGQYAAGFRTTPTGLDARSAHVPNPAGKDRPLYRLLTHSSDFAVQELIPADAETVTASACAPETNTYLARWLTRLDLLDPSGFLTDSQLADHLERSARYLGDECAQVTLAGTARAGLDSTGLNDSVSYRRVTDRTAAEAHLPEYTASVNAAIQGASDSLNGLATGSLSRLGALGAAGLGAQLGLRDSLEQLQGTIRQLKLVYAFRGDYLITAFSPAALEAALDEEAPVLADDDAFVAAQLETAGVAGWSYARAPEPVSADDLNAAIQASGKSALGGAGPEALDAVLAPVGAVAADLINRYGGLKSQATVEDGLILSQSSVAYTW